MVAALRRELPAESILYLGDTARLPYGSKSAETVSRYSQSNLAWLARQGAKAVVVACNTASAVALPSLSGDLPVWGVVEPGARQACEVTHGRVGVIATESTVRSGAYEKAIRALRPETAVSSIACPLFVPLVEEDWTDDPVTEMVVRRYLEPLHELEVDTMVLGCTHYPLLKPVISRVMGGSVTVVDSAHSLARDVRAALPIEASDGVGNPSLRLCFTDESSRASQLASRILGPDVLAEASMEWVDLGTG